MESAFSIQAVLTLLSVVLTGVVCVMTNRLNEQYKERLEEERKRQQRESAEEARRELENAAMREGMLVMLRDRIIQADTHFTKIGEVSALEKESMQKMYNAYHGLGGNDIATASYKRVIALPISQEEHIS